MWPLFTVQMWLQQGALAMTSVGIRELRDGLSRFLVEVREGRTVTITDHGRPIARIIPAGGPTALERLVAEGIVQPAQQRKRSAPTPVEASQPVTDLVAEQRR
jgi:prevent-host-death family protein